MMRPDVQPKQMRRHQQLLQQLKQEQTERMRKQQASWREQQQKGYVWHQELQKNNQHLFDAPKKRGNRVKGKIFPFQINRNLVKTPNRVHVKRGGFVQVVSVVIALLFIILAIYGVLWLLSTF